MLDKRLEGKSTRDITMKFVRENATEEELKPFVTKKNLLREYHIDLCDMENSEAISFFQEILDVLKSNPTSRLESDGWGEYDIVYREEQDVTIKDDNLVKHLQFQWKQQIKEVEDQRKEYGEFLRLKDKFEKGENK